MAPHAVAGVQGAGAVTHRGVLLHGPPGCANTMLVRAAANAVDAAFLLLGLADVYTTLYVGNTKARAKVGSAVHAQVYAKMSVEEKETVQRKMAEIDKVGASNGETPPPSPTLSLVKSIAKTRKTKSGVSSVSRSGTLEVTLCF